MNWNYSTFVIL